jgi:hypothetical protein
MRWRMTDRNRNPGRRFQSVYHSAGPMVEKVLRSRFNMGIDSAAVHRDPRWRFGLVWVSTQQRFIETLAGASGWCGLNDRQRWRSATNVVF